MNHRKALRVTTDTALAVFGLMFLGVVLWTSDEVLNWNILPDWIDQYAQLLVIILSVLAGFAVVMSVMTSLAVLAAAAARQAGVEEPPTPTRTRLVVGGCVATFLGLLAVFQVVDQYRELQATLRRQEKTDREFSEIQQDLRNRMPPLLAMFPGDLAGLSRESASGNEETVAQFLRAIRISIPREPDISVILRAAPPYKYCVIRTAPAAAWSEETGPVKPLSREYYIDLPERWERDTVTAMFGGTYTDVPRDRQGAFINTKTPSAWGLIQPTGSVQGVLMIRR